MCDAAILGDRRQDETSQPVRARCAIPAPSSRRFARALIQWARGRLGELRMTNDHGSRLAARFYVCRDGLIGRSGVPRGSLLLLPERWLWCPGWVSPCSSPDLVV